MLDITAIPTIKAKLQYRYQMIDENSTTPIVSVVVPTYNVQNYLHQAMDSLINQTLQDIEIIAVNDGSTDDSLAILSDYARNDLRVKVIDKPNGGYGHAMNIGIAAATGRYIAILEPDDFVDPSMFKDLSKVADEHNLDIVKSDFNRFRTTNGEIVKEFHPCCFRKENYNRVLDPSENLDIFRYVMNTWCGIYRRGFLLQHSIWHNETPGASFQDNGFFFQTMTRAKRVMYINKPHYMNRRDNPNSSVKAKDKVYAANKEYSYIEGIFKFQPLIAEIFGPLLYLKKFHTYLFTIKRIDPSLRHEFILNISKELAIDMVNGHFKQDVLSVSEWHNLNWIIRDPDEFYYDFVRGDVAVSVIIPVYNVATFLRQCLDSILNQTLKNIEMILIDDGSTDGSDDIIREYVMRDERVRAIYQKNHGAGAARNRGLDIAVGKYLSFLDADDFFEPLMLEKAYYKAMRDKNAEICVFKCANFDTVTGERTPNTRAVKIDKLPKQRPFTSGQIKENIFQMFIGWAWDKLFLRSFVFNHGLRFQEQETTNDMYFVYAALIKSTKITLLNEELAIHRRNVKTSVSNVREKTWWNFYYALIAVKQELVEMGVFIRYKKWFVNYALHSCLWNLHSLKTPVAEQLFDKLLEKWFEELEITGHNAEMFASTQEHALLEKMLRLGSGGYHDYVQIACGKTIVEAEPK